MFLRGFALAAVLAFILALGAPVLASEPTLVAAPVHKLDRMMLVGSPSLEEGAKPGLYLWLEDGAFHLAAVGDPKAKRTVYSLKVESTKELRLKPGDFVSKGSQPQGFRAEVTVEKVPARAQFVTDGDIEISEAVRVQGKGRAPIFLGPLAQPGARSVRIGRY